MSFIADDISVDTPAGHLEGVAAYRGFVETFHQIFPGADLVDILADGGPSRSCLTPTRTRSPTRCPSTG